MADSEGFDPMQYGAVAVEEPSQPFDPTQHGAIPVEQPQQPSGLQQGLETAQKFLGYAQRGVMAAIAPGFEIQKQLYPASLVESPLVSPETATGVIHAALTPIRTLEETVFGDRGKAGAQFAEKFLGEQAAGLTSPESLALLAVPYGVGKFGATPKLAETAGIAKPEVPPETVTPEPTTPVATDTVAKETIQPQPVPEAVQAPAVAEQPKIAATPEEVIPNAIQEPSAGEILQRQPETVGAAGGERIGVEPGQQGQEVAQTGVQEPQVVPTVPQPEPTGITPAAETPTTVGEVTPQEQATTETPTAAEQPKTETAAAPPTETGKSTEPISEQTGIGGSNIAAMEQRPIETPEAGTVIGQEENNANGHAWLDAGGDPNTIIQKFADTGAVNTADMGRMNAALQRLQAATDVAGDALRKDPGNPELETAYRSALDKEQRFSDAFKPMHTFASANLASLKGKVPLTEDAAKSFTGMHREFQANMGREFNPEEAVKAEKLVQKNTAADQKYQDANQELFKTVDESLKDTPSKIPGRRAPTFKELGDMFSEKLREVCDV